MRPAVTRIASASAENSRFCSSLNSYWADLYSLIGGRSGAGLDTAHLFQSGDRTNYHILRVIDRRILPHRGVAGYNRGRENGPQAETIFLFRLEVRHSATAQTGSLATAYCALLYS